MNKKRIEKKPKRNLCIAIIAIAVALAFLVPTSAVFANDVNLTITNVRFDPPSQTVEKGETFTVSYYVEPTDWVIGANFVTITFDPILLEANEVTEGTLFGGDAFLFEGGTIDNVAGTISEGFACVKVENNVSTPGSIFVIEFTAKDKIGTSSLVMSGVEVHGIGGILPITVESGSVTVEGVEKVWDLYAKWESDDPTNVMISWNNNEFNSCEYNNITLMQYDPFDMEWDFAADMLVATSYVYTPRWFNEQWLNDQFQIRATWNNPPNTPSNPNPSDSITDVDINADLNWTCDEFVWNVTLNFNEDNGNRDYVVFGEAPDANDGEPPDSYDMPKPPAPQPPYIRAWFDDNLPIPYDKLGEDYRNCGVTYDVYFGSSSPPPLIISRHSQTTYDPGKLDYGTQYYWQIVAWDNYGASISGPIWSFTTEGSDDNGGNGGGNGGGTTTNLPPVADANGPYIGAIGIPVTFDGSSSSDPDIYLQLQMQMDHILGLLVFL